MTGRLVKKLDLGFKGAGGYMDKGSAAYWDGTNQNGEGVASGVYKGYISLDGQYNKQPVKIVINK